MFPENDPKNFIAIFFKYINIVERTYRIKTDYISKSCMNVL